LKQYTPKLVSKWIKAKNLIGVNRPPKPFPGKAPTRIMLNAIINKKSFSYFGKPSRPILLAFHKFINIPFRMPVRAYNIYAEFDKSGLIVLAKNQVGLLPELKYNEKLWVHYHPEVMVENKPSWLNWPYSIVKGTYKIG
jgi:hypothetical protein